jgi:cob(I)alamin adenosyltransferase
MNEMDARGLLMINTGDGKGKTTAAFGQALRVAGHGQKVCIIQFIKGKWPTGEGRAMARLADCVELHVCGSGFTWQAEDLDEVVQAAVQGWRLAREKIASGSFRLIVLDELTYPINYGIIAEDEVLATLAARPAHLDILITGRGAGAGLLAVADLVTEMREVKHPYRKGLAARQGIEY